jgi:predicted  nucleic acid-binding Zn-ribbon protein
LEWIPLQDINQKVARLETKVEEHEKLLQKQQERNDTQTELNTLLKMQIEANKEQNETLQKFSDTLVKINKNLDNLNSKQELLDERVTGIEDSLSKQNFSIVDVIKYIGAAGIGLILAWIYTKLGINKN